MNTFRCASDSTFANLLPSGTQHPAVTSKRAPTPMLRDNRLVTRGVVIIRADRAAEDSL